MVQLFISSSTAFCFHANRSEDFNGARITPLVRALSDLCFVLAASRVQLCRDRNLTRLWEKRAGWMEPLNVGSVQASVPAAPPVPSSCSPQAPPLVSLRCSRGPGRSGVAAWAVALRKPLTAALTRPCAHSGRLCPSPGAAPGARGQPALQVKQRKVRVSRQELCPRLKKHILAEERNTIQAGRETRLPSSPLREAFGSLQLLESLLPFTGLFIFTGFYVFVFCLLDQCCRGDRAEQNRSSGDWRVQPCTGGQTASLSCLSLSHCVALGHCHFPLCPGSSAIGWFHPAQLSACLPSLSL